MLLHQMQQFPLLAFSDGMPFAPSLSMNTENNFNWHNTTALPCYFILQFVHFSGLKIVLDTMPINDCPTIQTNTKQTGTPPSTVVSCNMHNALQSWSSEQKLDLQNMHHIRTEKQSLLLTYVSNMEPSYMYNTCPRFSVTSLRNDRMF
jgi:hypothetical protein